MAFSFKSRLTYCTEVKHRFESKLTMKEALKCIEDGTIKAWWLYNGTI